MRSPPYPPILLLKSNCHKIGHKQIICPEPQVCSTCGKPHEETRPRQSDLPFPHSFLLDMPKTRHLATDKYCPKRIDIVRRIRETARKHSAPLKSRGSLKATRQDFQAKRRGGRRSAPPNPPAPTATVVQVLLTMLGLLQVFMAIAAQMGTAMQRNPNPQAWRIGLALTGQAASEPGKRLVRVVNWDLYRNRLVNSKARTLCDAIKEAIAAATTKKQVELHVPTPDLHLLNLWVRRLRALQRYRRGSKNARALREITQATIATRKYAAQLNRQKVAGLWCLALGKDINLQAMGHGTAKTWLTTGTQQCQAALSVIRRLCGTRGGLDEEVARQIVKAFIVSRICHGVLHYRLTKTEWKKLEVLNNNAAHVITGLPRYSLLSILKAHTRLNTIQGTVEERARAHLERLQHSVPGRLILEMTGSDNRAFPDFRRLILPGVTTLAAWTTDRYRGERGSAVLTGKHAKYVNIANS
ncbi:hypothetical protein HPB47_002415 [Ixodes persulcatus]|uniref:Uncharacterized protein n=1 Tax=Ixodes persulcatus TaxID=34615 RepID=A0AC60PLB2_IXOPE|nr:hypothetical protein HPB47_002415 [Ixodes persulcatus]